MRLAIIGLGLRLGRLLNEALRNEIPDLRVVGVIDPDRASAMTKLKAEEQSTVHFCSSVEELLKKTKPDAVAIGTRCNLHASFAAKVLRHHLPLFLEKPVAVSMQQAQMLEKAAERSKSRTIVSFPLRMTPLCRQARELIERGAVGLADHFLAVNYVPYGNVYFDSWYKDYRITGGLSCKRPPMISIISAISPARRSCGWLPCSLAVECTRTRHDDETKAMSRPSSILASGRLPPELMKTLQVPCWSSPMAHVALTRRSSIASAMRRRAELR